MPRSTNNTHTLVMEKNPLSPVSEAYRTLRTNIQFSAVDEELRVIMVTSAQPGEGKSTTAANLALAYAQAGNRVLVVDADLRKPTMHKVFQKSNRLGLTNLLTGQRQLTEIHLDAAGGRLDVLTSGPIPPNPSELLASKRMEALLVEWKEQYDLVIVDTPPAAAVTDAAILSSRCDGVVLVVDSGHVKKETVKRAKTNLEHAKARILGVVLNNHNRKEAEEYYYYYGKSSGE